MLFKKKKKQSPFLFWIIHHTTKLGALSKRDTGVTFVLFLDLLHALCLSHKISLRAKSHPIFGTIVVGLGLLGLKKKDQNQKNCFKILMQRITFLWARTKCIKPYKLLPPKFFTASAHTHTWIWFSHRNLCKSILFFSKFFNDFVNNNS